jgi:1-acyl-sn-glycerol-3-phosphate acyltransferase
VAGVGPLLPDSGPPGPRLLRRVRGIALEALAFVVATVLLPLLLVVAAAVDLVLWVRRRKPWVGVRLVAMLWWFLLGELRGVATIFAIGIAAGGRDSAMRRARLYRLRQRWAAMHLGGVRRLFGLRVEVEGLADVAPGPVLIFMRHASIVDNMLPDAIVGRGHGLGLRFVIKRELQVLPTIDIGGRWVPTVFVRRAGTDPEAELAQVRKLTVDLGPDEGVLIYPEGTRHTAAKLARAQATIAERQPEIAPLADRLRHVLPPRLGGPLALLEAGGTDVVFCGHVGFDGFERVSDIWQGGLVGSTVRVRFWRHAAEAVPADRDDRIAWLYEQWQVMDDWIGSHRDATLVAADAEPLAGAAA